MKKCGYCGKEYSDEVTHCLVDNEPLPSQTVQAVAVPADLKSSRPGLALNALGLTETQMRVVEVVLVFSVAFGGSTITALYDYSKQTIYHDYSSSTPEYALYRVAYSCFHQLSVLGLVLYVLYRRNVTVRDLGLRWRATDFPKSIVLGIAKYLAFRLVYEAIYHTGLTKVSYQSEGYFVSHYLYRGGVSVLEWLHELINPFYEELIVRAYLMTEVFNLTKNATKAILLSTLLQSLYHIYQGGAAAVAHGAAFLIASIYYARTRNIGPVILAHLYADVGPLIHYLHWL